MAVGESRAFVRSYFSVAATNTLGQAEYVHSSASDKYWKSVRTGANTATSAFRVISNRARLTMAAVVGSNYDTPAVTEAAFLKTVSPANGEALGVKYGTSLYLGGGIFAGFSGTGGTWYELIHQFTGTTTGNVLMRKRTGTTYLNSTLVNIGYADLAWGTSTAGAANQYMKLQVIDGRVKARVWAYGQAEPTTWLFDVAASAGATTFGYGGIIGTNTDTVSRYVEFSHFSMSAWNTTTNVWYNHDPSTSTVSDVPTGTTGNTIHPMGWGTSTSGHEWRGDIAAGESVTSLTKSNTSALSRTGSTGLRISKTATGTVHHAHGIIGPERVDSLQEMSFSYAAGTPNVRLFFRGTTVGTTDYSPRASNGSGIEVSVSSTGAVLGAVHKSGTIDSGSTGITTALNVLYTLKAQIRSGMLHGKFWRASLSEPPEWQLKTKLPVDLNSSGFSGPVFIMVNDHSFYLKEYYASNTTERSFVYGDVTNALKSTMIASKVPGRIRRSTVSGALTSTMSAVPQLGKKSSVTRQIEATTSPAPARTRYNYIGSGYVGGILTKFNYLPDLNGKVAATIQPRRRRKSTVTRSIKGTLTVVPRRRYFVNTTPRTLKITAIGRGKIIITRTVSRSVEMTLIGAPVGYKTGATTRAIKFTRPSVASRKRVKSTVTREIISRMRIRFGPTVEDEANFTIHLGTAQSPSFVKFAGKSTDRLVSGSYFHGFVPRRVEGSVETGFELSKYAQGFIKTPQSASNIARVSMRTFPVRAKPAKVNASISVGMYMDTSDFAWMYEDALEKRASMIHYACTSVAGQGIIITYRHEVPDTLQSRTYFLAKLDDDTVLLYGYSTNVWNTNTILVNIVEDSTHPEWENVKSALSIKV